MNGKVERRKGSSAGTIISENGIVLDNRTRGRSLHVVATRISIGFGCANRNLDWFLCHFNGIRRIDVDADGCAVITATVGSSRRSDYKSGSSNKSVLTREDAHGVLHYNIQGTMVGSCALFLAVNRAVSARRTANKVRRQLRVFRTRECQRCICNTRALLLGIAAAIARAADFCSGFRHRHGFAFPGAVALVACVANSATLRRHIILVICHVCIRNAFGVNRMLYHLRNDEHIEEQVVA